MGLWYQARAALARRWRWLGGEAVGDGGVGGGGRGGGGDGDGGSSSIMMLCALRVWTISGIWSEKPSRWRDNSMKGAPSSRDTFFGRCR